MATNNAQNNVSSFIPGMTFTGVSYPRCSGHGLASGDNDLYKIVLTMNVGQDGESITVEKLATATGQAPINQDTVINIKNNVVFLTVEKTIDSLGSVAQIPTPETRPLSDDIKDDLEGYDLTEASGIYFNREIRITLPKEGIELIYDMQWGYWQPPQLRAIGRYAIIEIEDGCVATHIITDSTFIQSNNPTRVSHTATKQARVATDSAIGQYSYTTDLILLKLTTLKDASTILCCITADDTIVDLEGSSFRVAKATSIPRRAVDNLAIGQCEKAPVGDSTTNISVTNVAILDRHV